MAPTFPVLQAEALLLGRGAVPRELIPHHSAAPVSSEHRASCVDRLDRLIGVHGHLVGRVDREVSAGSRDLAPALQNRCKASEVTLRGSADWHVRFISAPLPPVFLLSPQPLASHLFLSVPLFSLFTPPHPVSLSLTGFS